MWRRVRDEIFQSTGEIREEKLTTTIWEAMKVETRYCIRLEYVKWDARRKLSEWEVECKCKAMTVAHSFFLRFGQLVLLKKTGEQPPRKPKKEENTNLSRNGEKNDYMRSFIFRTPKRIWFCRIQFGDWRTASVKRVPSPSDQTWKSLRKNRGRHRETDEELKVGINDNNIKSCPETVEQNLTRHGKL